MGTHTNTRINLEHLLRRSTKAENMLNEQITQLQIFEENQRVLDAKVTRIIQFIDKLKKSIKSPFQLFKKDHT